MSWKYLGDVMSRSVPEVLKDALWTSGRGCHEILLYFYVYALRGRGRECVFTSSSASCEFDGATHKYNS